MDQLTKTLVESASLVGIAAISTLTAMLLSYLAKLRSKAQAEIEKVENDSTQVYLSNVLNTIYNNLSASIDKVEVTLVKELKAASADGKLTEEDKLNVAEAAKELCKEITSKEMMDALSDIVGDTEEYLLTLIDSLVLQKKVNGQDLAGSTMLINS